MIEKWASIECHPSYEVSNLGRIRRGEGIRKVQVGRNGYARVMLEDRKCHLVHRLVASAFCDGFGVQVNHKNGIKDDNRSENLEWVSASENQRHRFRVLKNTHWATGMVGDLNPLSKPVLAVAADGTKTRFANARIAVEHGVATNHGHVNSCCNGRRKSHAGHSWEWAK